MKLIIWDFDGTLGYRGPSADAQSKWTGALMELLAREMPDLTPARETLGQHLMAGEPWNTPEVPHPDLTDPDAWWERFYPAAESALRAAGVRDGRVPELARRFRNEFTDLRHWHLFDDTLPTLTHLSRLGWIHVVLSNHVPELGAIVSHVGLAPNIQALYNSAETGYEKPHPRALEMVRQNYPNAGPIWVIGDSLSADVAGAQQAGLPSILVRRPDLSPDELSQVEHHCADLDGVVELLARGQPAQPSHPRPD